MDSPTPDTGGAADPSPFEEKPYQSQKEEDAVAENSAEAEAENDAHAIQRSGGDGMPGAPGDPTTAVPAFPGVHSGVQRSSHTGEGLAHPMDQEAHIAQPPVEDLFEWEKVTCDPPYYLQGKNQAE